MGALPMAMMLLTSRSRLTRAGNQEAGNHEAGNQEAGNPCKMSLDVLEQKLLDVHCHDHRGEAALMRDFNASLKSTDHYNNDDSGPRALQSSAGGPTQGVSGDPFGPISAWSAAIARILMVSRLSR